jgi:cobalt-zinc-cadmium efflux system membrane fusion protein
MTRLSLRGLAALLLALALGACGDQRKATAGEPATEVGHDDDHDEHGAAGLVRLTPAQVATAKLAFVAAEARTVTSELVSNGEVVPPDDGVARIGAKVAGRVARFTVGVGDPVRRGQTIALLDSPELGRAKADYIAAVAAMTVTRQTAEREQALFDRKISSERDLRDAEATATRARADKEAAEVRLHTLGISDAQLARISASDHLASGIAVTSPIDGVVVDRLATLGETLDAGAPLFVDHGPADGVDASPTSTSATWPSWRSATRSLRVERVARARLHRHDRLDRRHRGSPLADRQGPGGDRQR